MKCICPICKREFDLPERLFIGLWMTPRGLVYVPSNRAAHYHDTPEGKHCPSNGVKKINEAT